MTIFNIVTEENINAKKIAKIEEERDSQLSMIDQRFQIVNEKFENIFGRSIDYMLNNVTQNSEKYKEGRIKAIEINEKFNAKRSAIRAAAQEQIEQIKAEEKAAKINELDNLVNEICA